MFAPFGGIAMGAGCSHPMLVPVLYAAAALWAFIKGVDLWGALTDGGVEGANATDYETKLSLRISAPGIGLLTARAVIIH